jgi:hypothetical protein
MAFFRWPGLKRESLHHACHKSLHCFNIFARAGEEAQMPGTRWQRQGLRIGIQTAQKNDLALCETPVVFSGDDLNRKRLNPRQAGVNGIVFEKSSILNQERTLVL